MKMKPTGNIFPLESPAKPFVWFDFEMRGWGFVWIGPEKSQEGADFWGMLLFNFFCYPRVSLAGERNGIEFGQQKKERNCILCLLKWLIWFCKKKIFHLFIFNSTHFILLHPFSGRTLSLWNHIKSTHKHHFVFSYFGFFGFTIKLSYIFHQKVRNLNTPQEFLY